MRQVNHTCNDSKFLCPLPKTTLIIGFQCEYCVKNEVSKIISNALTNANRLPRGPYSKIYWTHAVVLGSGIIALTAETGHLRFYT